MRQVEILHDGSALALTAPPKSTLRFHAVWLRDNAPDAETRSQGNGQRLIALRNIPTETVIEAATIVDDNLQVTFMPENKTVDFNVDWLIGHAYDRPMKPIVHGQVLFQPGKG